MFVRINNCWLNFSCFLNRHSLDFRTLVSFVAWSYSNWSHRLIFFLCIDFNSPYSPILLSYLQLATTTTLQQVQLVQLVETTTTTSTSVTKPNNKPTNQKNQSNQQEQTTITTKNNNNHLHYKYNNNSYNKNN